jgi:hypothetical protein
MHGGGNHQRLAIVPASVQSLKYSEEPGIAKVELDQINNNVTRLGGLPQTNN